MYCFSRRGVPEVIIPLLTIDGAIRSSYDAERNAHSYRY